VSAGVLGVGDPAPALQVKEFVKGAPIKSLQKGKPYVVEFWATWCGPCRVSIPHLTELQKKHPEFTFIGVSVWEQDQKAVRPFVDQMGDKMAYTVALDDVPAGADGNQGKMAKSWMQAAGQDGIPSAFLIGRDGRIAWIGHPMGLAEPLAKVAAGTWDVAAARAQHQTQLLQRRKMNELRGKLAKAQQSGDPRQVLAVYDQAIAADPAMETMLGIPKYNLLAQQIKDPERAMTYGNRLVGSVLKENAGMLNELAWSIVAPEAPKASADAVSLALKAAKRADELTQGKDAGIADTLAKAYFDSGRLAEAVQAQERAVQLSKGTPLESNPSLTQRLEQYRKALPQP
jgi:thiol-disulfide isomerase/thioredoxin